ncbi:MAG: hypothetical protein HQL50_09980, partial [Magnetococcales bacterium]|nr:hypothetical protein [Magnetococcales bacterium]
MIGRKGKKTATGKSTSSGSGKRSRRANQGRKRMKKAASSQRNRGASYRSWRVPGQDRLGSVELPDGRSNFVAGFFVLAFVILAIRAVDLAVLQGDTLQKKAQRQHETKV